MQKPEERLIWGFQIRFSCWGYLPGSKDAVDDDTDKIWKKYKDKGGYIGLHTQSTSDDINYVISGTGKAICDL